MAVKPAQGSGIGQVITPYPEFGGPMALQAGLRAAEPQYAEQITGGVEDYTGGLVGGAMGIVDLIGQLASKAVDPRLQAIQSTVVPGEPSSYEIDTISPRQSGIISDDLEADAAGASVGEQMSSLATRLAEQKQTPRLGSFQAGADTVDQTPPQQEAPAAPAEDIIRTSVQDYLDIIGKDTKAQTTEDYIKEFADATGLDVSGKPDNSTALMTLGLALMQNKAGKGFDVGKMLGAVGEAGEKAMPAFENAKKEARALRAKAGEYALGRTREDAALARQRGGYYIVPKSQGISARIKAFTEDSKRADLNAFELEALYDNQNFRKNFDIIPASEYNSVYAELTKKPEYGDMYASSYTKIPLFEGAGDDLSFEVQRVNANYKGPNAPTRGYFPPDQYKDFAARLDSAKAGLDRTGKKLAEAYSLVNAGEVTTPKQVGDAITSFGRAFGIKFSEGATDTDKVKRILNVISAERAPEILGEAGKTISDADRERVNRIVGELGLVEDPERLKDALNDIYDTIVIGGYRDIESGYNRLNLYAGVTPQSRPKSLKKNESGTFDATVE